MGFIDFTNGEVLTADQMDTVMRQGIMRFADASARDTALSAVLAEGMMCYLDDTNEVLKYDGASWIDISGDITGVTAGTALTGGGTSGNVTVNADISALSTAQAGNALNANGELLDVDEAALSITASQISDITATATELNFVDGVTSAIQSQLNDKQDDVITTQGDLVIGDASGDPVRLPVGTADQVLTSDGTTVSFQDAGGGGWELLSTTSLSGSTVQITGIDQSYTHLMVRIYGLTADANGSNLFYLQKADTTDISVRGLNMDRDSVQAYNAPHIVIFDVRGDEPDISMTGQFFNYSSSSNKNMIFQVSYDVVGIGGMGQFYTLGTTESDPIEGIEFESAGNFTGGTIEIWGV